MSLILALLWSSPADAAEVVWLQQPATPEDAARIVALAEARGPGIPMSALAGQADSFSDARDGKAYADLEAALRDVRAFEQRLDGELLIMRDLEDPIAAISVMRNEQDRTRLYAALAYQGFAVDRFFESTLAEDERAAPYRTTVAEQVVSRPWRDAIALEPERAISAYEIAEAPQRVRYETLRGTLTSALPGALSLDGSLSGATLLVDGRVIKDTSGVIRVAPGRHFAHLVVGDRIVDRWSGEVASGGRIELPLVAPDPGRAMAWRDQLPAAPPAELVDDLAAVGDTVWLVDPTGEGRVFEWTRGGVRQLDVELFPRTTAAPSSEPRFTAGFAVGGGWFATHDFYLQDPVNADPDWSTVNSGAIAVSATFGVDVGRLRFEAGSDLLVTPGGNHVALWKDNATHLRGFPHVAAGIPAARLAVGWLTPHHVGLSPRVAIPLGRLEIVGNGILGLAVTPDPDVGTWEGEPVFSAWAGLGVRLGKLAE